MVTSRLNVAAASETVRGGMHSPVLLNKKIIQLEMYIVMKFLTNMNHLFI